MVMLASPLMHMVNGTMIEIDGGQEKSLMDRLRDKNDRSRLLGPVEAEASPNLYVYIDRAWEPSETVDVLRNPDNLRRS